MTMMMIIIIIIIIIIIRRQWSGGKESHWNRGAVSQWERSIRQINKQQRTDRCKCAAEVDVIIDVVYSVSTHNGLGTESQSDKIAVTIRFAPVFGWRSAQKQQRRGPHSHSRLDELPPPHTAPSQFNRQHPPWLWAWSKAATSSALVISASKKTQPASITDAWS